MDLFSSSAEETINKKITCISDDSLITSEAELIEVFDLNKCLQFINNQNFSKFSVRVALWLESQIKQKVFILGDTSYGSCCVDELAAEHVGGDAVIHFGHACLSPTSRLPVFYMLPRASLDIPKFTSVFSNFCSNSNGTILVLYDIAYNHYKDELREVVRPFGDRVVLSQLSIPGSDSQVCSSLCAVHQGSTTHQTSMLGRSFCCPTPANAVYIAHKHAQNMMNFALSFRDVQFYTYAGGEMETVDFNKTLRRRLFLVEKVKDAKTLGIIVGTLSVENFLSAIERVKKLASYRGKRCYIFSVGKPNPAKLANFPEIEVFVLVSCPEARLEGDREYLQPVVTLLEAELALNSNRKWDDQLSVDFRDLLQGASVPEGEEPLAADVSLISNRIRSDTVVADSDTEISSQLTVREHHQLSVTNTYQAGRSWSGLEQALGETPVSLAIKGRSGIAMAYDEEKSHQT